MFHNSLQTQVTEVAVDARASAVSLHAFSYFVGQAIGPVLFGLGLTTLGQGGAAAVSGVAILVLGLLAARVIGQPRARSGGTPWSGSQTLRGGSPLCQNTSIGMPPRGYQ